MRLTTDALIIRENNNIGEADRFVTALTRDLGLVRASARGARNLRSRNASATQLLSYSRLTLYKGREKYIIDDAEPLRVFFELRADIEKLSLAQYFCELAGVLAPQEEPAGEFLRLLLNALHLLGEGSRPVLQVKAVTELRLLTLAGFMPDLVACADCGAYESAQMVLLPQEGTLRCAHCRAALHAGKDTVMDMDADTVQPAQNTRSMYGLAETTPRYMSLTPPVLAAMRHIVYAPFEKCFSFTLSPDGCAALSAVSEAYLQTQLQRGFHTLSFFHSL